MSLSAYNFSQMIIDFASNGLVSLSLSLFVYVCTDVYWYVRYLYTSSHVPIVFIDKRHLLSPMEIMRGRIKIVRIIGRRPLAFAALTTRLNGSFLFLRSPHLVYRVTYRCP